MKAKSTAALNKIVLENQEASKFARKLMDASVGPLVAISPDGNITDVNKAFVKAIGLTREKLIGNFFFEYVNESIKAHKVCMEVFKKGSFKDIPLTLRLKHRKLTELIFNGSVYKDQNGIIQGAIMVAINITAQIDELGLAKKQIAFQNKEKIKRAEELSIATTEIAFQNSEKIKRANELIIANIELAFQNSEKIKRAEELIIANTELAFQKRRKRKKRR